MFTDCELFHIVIEGVEGVAGVELLVVFSMAALYFPVVPGCIWPDFLMSDVEFLQGHLKQCRLLFFAVSHFIGKFRAIISLDALNQMWELSDHVS